MPLFLMRLSYQVFLREQKETLVKLLNKRKTHLLKTSDFVLLELSENSRPNFANSEQRTNDSKLLDFSRRLLTR